MPQKKDERYGSSETTMGKLVKVASAEISKSVQPSRSLKSRDTHICVFFSFFFCLSAT